MTPRISHDDPDRTLACPDCDIGGYIYKREREDEYEHPCRCENCGATFDAPVDRETLEQTPPGSPADNDALPTNLDADAKQRIRSMRDGGKS